MDIHTPSGAGSVTKARNIIYWWICSSFTCCMSNFSFWEVFSKRSCKHYIRQIVNYKCTMPLLLKRLIAMICVSLWLHLDTWLNPILTRQHAHLINSGGLQGDSYCGIDLQRGSVSPKADIKSTLCPVLLRNFVAGLLIVHLPSRPWPSRSFSSYSPFAHTVLKVNQ